MFTRLFFTRFSFLPVKCVKVNFYFGYISWSDVICCKKNAIGTSNRSKGQTFIWSELVKHRTPHNTFHVNDSASPNEHTYNSMLSCYNLIFTTYSHQNLCVYVCIILCTFVLLKRLFVDDINEVRDWIWIFYAHTPSEIYNDILPRVYFVKSEQCSTFFFSIFHFSSSTMITVFITTVKINKSNFYIVHYIQSRFLMREIQEMVFVFSKLQVAAKCNAIN